MEGCSVGYKILTVYPKLITISSKVTNAWKKENEEIKKEFIDFSNKLNQRL